MRPGLPRPASDTGAADRLQPAIRRPPYPHARAVSHGGPPGDLGAFERQARRSANRHRRRRDGTGTPM